VAHPSGDLESVNVTADLRRIAVALAQVAEAKNQLRDAVIAARTNGRSWGRISLVLGVSKQAARQRFRTAAEATTWTDRVSKRVHGPRSVARRSRDNAPSGCQRCPGRGSNPHAPCGAGGFKPGQDVSARSPGTGKCCPDWDSAQGCPVGVGKSGSFGVVR
jgi:hypothetical protein